MRNFVGQWYHVKHWQNFVQKLLIKFSQILKNRQSVTACSLLHPCYDSVVNCPGAETTTTQNYPQTKDNCNHALWWTKQIYFSPKVYFHSTSPEIKDISSPLTIVSCTLCYTPEQYTIKRLNIAAIRILICFSRVLKLHSTPGLALSIEISCSPKWLLAFLKKNLLPPEDSSFSPGIQLRNICI